MADYLTPIAESNSFIVLDKYSREWKIADSYQSEDALEREFIQDLVAQGYEFLPGLNTQKALLANVRMQLQALNAVQFSDGEWLRFVETYLDKPSDGIDEKTRKIHDDYIHDFVFDDGHIQISVAPKGVMYPYSAYASSRTCASRARTSSPTTSLTKSISASWMRCSSRDCRVAIRCLIRARSMVFLVILLILGYVGSEIAAGTTRMAS